jgi:hypothetical protein
LTTRLRAADERAHEPGADRWWWETWHLDAATHDGIGVSVRLACAPAIGVAWWWTHLLLPDRPGPVVVRDHEVPLPRQGLEVRADGLWGELDCETPFDHWTYGLEAFGVMLDDPADSLHGEIGERMPVGLDIEWDVEPSTSPYEYERGGERGYEQFGVVHGDVLLGRERFEIEAVGLRSHAWGAPRVDHPVTSSWLHSGDELMSFHVAESGVDGYVIGPDGTRTISSVRSVTRRRADGLPLAGRYVVDDRYEIDTEVIGLVTIPLVGPDGGEAVLARGLCRSTGFGERVIGWSSWLDPVNNEE